MSERESKLIGGLLPGLRNSGIFSGTHGQEYLLPLGEGTNGHTLSFISWLLIRIKLLAFLMQTVVTYCRHVDFSTRYVGQRYPD